MPPGAAAADASSTKTFGGTTPSSAAVTSRTVAVDREVEYVTQKLGSSLGSGGTAKAFNSFFSYCGTITTIQYITRTYFSLHYKKKGRKIKGVLTTQGKQGN